jgi:NDP-sugar pyrophosphorylase family protein
MRAIILAGGKGTRLYPYTTLIPKPLVPIGGKYSILEIVIMQLAQNGFTHVTLAVNHLSNLIMAYFGDGSRLGLKIDYSIEDKELSTIGPLTLIDDLPNDFLVMNGDILCDLNFGDFLKEHIASKRQISVSAYRRKLNVDFGVLEYNANNILTGFKEKPAMDFDVSMGIYCLNRSVISDLPRGEKYGYDNLMLDSIASGQNVYISPFSGYWLDIGRPDDYEYANQNFALLSEKLGIK